MYQARDTRLGRDVALKFLPAASAQEPEALKRFQREARAVSTLNHPDICTLYDIGEHEGEPFLVLELLEGQSLKERLQAAPLPSGEVVDLALQITGALEAAHAKGIVHRDIKPGNIYLTSTGHAKILDFGLAKLLTEPRGAEEAAGGGLPLPGEETITRTGATMGTVAYMSPEQARGEEVGARTDLCSLGATLYQAATGIMPFPGEAPERTLEAIVHQPSRKPRELNPRVPPSLEGVILKALEKDRTVRYQTAAGMRAELERLRPAPRGSRWPQAAAWALLAALVVIVIGSRSGWYRAQPQIAELTPRQVTANPAEDPVVRVGISQDGEYVAYTDLTGIQIRRIDSGETRSLPPQKGFCFR